MGCHKLQTGFLKVKEETGSTNSFELRLWDSRIGRWMSPDNLKVYDTPYWGMGNNPISAVDPDGNDIIYLNHSTGASGFGHSAVLIGNNKDGWRFVSKEGRERYIDKNGEKAKRGTMATGGKSTILVLPEADGVEKFTTLKQALNHSDIKHYDRAIRYKTTTDQDNKAFKVAVESGNTKYHFTLNNCSHCAGDALNSAGYNPGYIDPTYRSYGSPSGPPASVVPNNIFYNLMNFNQGSLLNLNSLRNTPKATVETGKLKQITPEEFDNFNNYD